MENKQTAVEWLYFELKKTNITIALIINQNIDLFEQAKTMERDQIEEAYNAGLRDSVGIQTADLKHGEKYFTQKYGNGKEI